MELDSLLAQMVERSASDLHLAVDVPPVFRVSGDLVAAPLPSLTVETMGDLLGTALPEDNLARARQGRDFSATLRLDAQTFRCHVFRERGQLAAAIRVVPDQIPSLEELSLPPVFERLTQSKRGLILLAGPTGSGKSTTMLSMLDHINRTRAERICTVEAPMQYVLASKLSLVTQRVVGEDVESCKQGLLSVMETDPDVVLIGEMRTPETARLALEMADKGHLVFSQMTAETTADALERLLALLGEPQTLARRLLARTMQAIIAQNLLRREDRPGRVAVNEILLTTPRVRQMIIEGQIDSTLLAMAMESSHRWNQTGMQTMDDALLALHAAGVISHEAAGNHLREKGRLPPAPG